MSDKNIDKDTKKFLDNMGNRLKLAKENGCKVLDCKTIDNNIKLRLENIKLRKELEIYKKIADEIKELRDTIQKEYEYAMEGFMKKQLATSVVDGTIAQETGWILNRIDEILNIGQEKR